MAVDAALDDFPFVVELGLVSAREQGEILAYFASLKGDIVEVA